MRTSTPCPDIRSFQDLIAGASSLADKESLLQHLEICDACAARIQTLPQQDMLLSCIRQAKSSSNALEDQQLVTLVQRLIQLQRPADPPHSTADAAGSLGSVFASKDTSSSRLLPFACAGCGKPLRVQENLAGKKVKCPRCGQVIAAPAVVREPEPARTTPPVTVETVAMSKSAVSQDNSAKDLCAFLAPSQAADELGRLGSYRVLKVLGRGGMGVVFRAEDPHLQRLVALKAMLPALAADESARQRFLREARAAASLKHDHIVSIYQVGEDRGAPFLAMEFLEGEALDDRLKREGKLPLPEVLRIGREIAEGLEAAHEHGLIHRDIKPGNVWLEGKRGRVKILDFGLARTNTDDIHLTQSGAIVGTPAYMPPEQARGEKVDSRCDLYSLGCVLYRLCTGELPFKGDNAMSLLMALAIEQPKSPREINPDVPPPLADLILRLLAKDAAQRPATAGEVAKALHAIDTGEPVVVKAARAPAPPRRRRRLAVAAAAGTLLLAGMLTIIVIIRNKKGEEIARVNVPKDGSVEVKNKEGGQTLPKSEDGREERSAAKIPPPVQITEPPPLAEWLKGRKVLTVSQDGKGQYKTIQAALEALKPNQVVKVLDRGPYRECLNLENVPADSGLVSEERTLLEFPGNWRKLGERPEYQFTGHYLGNTAGFRLHGFCFSFPEKKGSVGLHLYQPDGFVLEKCRFQTPAGKRDPGAPNSQQAIRLVAFDIDFVRPVVFRESQFDGGINLLSSDALRGTDFLVEKNYFTDFCGMAGSFRKLILRGNVFRPVSYRYLSFWNLKNAAFVELSNNTLLGDVLFQVSAPRGAVHLRNNLVVGRESFQLNGGAEKALPEASKNWQSDHNAFRGHSGSLLLPLRATDRLAPIAFLSQDPDDPNYLRLPAGSPLAKGGTGGAWPSYIGALPPGPAPKDGDWFTHLRAKWLKNEPKGGK